MTKTSFCGMDFGTSNSSIGIQKNNVTQMVKLEKDKVVIPSSIFIDENNQRFFGNKAVKLYAEDLEEGRFMKSLKNVLGTDLVDHKTLINNRLIRLSDLIGIYVKFLKERAEASLEQEIDKIVIGRPVIYSENPKEDTRAKNSMEEILKRQGFKHIEFMYEPVAAAFSYSQKSVNKESIALISDIGGGTADFSVVKLKPNKQNPEILSNTGVHIGGTDFDKALSLITTMPYLGYKMPMNEKLDLPNSTYFNLSSWEDIKFLYSEETLDLVKKLTHNSSIKKTKIALNRLSKILKYGEGHSLLLRVESAKIGLSNNESVDIIADLIEKDLKIKAYKKDFESAIECDAIKIINCIKQAVSDANLKFKDIDKVFLVGGASSTPLIKNNLKRLLPNAEFIKNNIFSSVGQGLSEYSTQAFG